MNGRPALRPGKDQPFTSSQSSMIYFLIFEKKKAALKKVRQRGEQGLLLLGRFSQQKMVGNCRRFFN